MLIHLPDLKFQDLIDPQTAPVMFKAKNYRLLSRVQRLSELREGQYYLRDSGIGVLKTIRARTNTKNNCVSFKGVNLWNSFDKELRTGTIQYTFKKKVTQIRHELFSIGTVYGPFFSVLYSFFLFLLSVVSCLV